MLYLDLIFEDPAYINWLSKNHPKYTAFFRTLSKLEGKEVRKFYFSTRHTKSYLTGATTVWIKESPSFRRFSDVNRYSLNIWLRLLIFVRKWKVDLSSISGWVPFPQRYLRFSPCQSLNRPQYNLSTSIHLDK